MNEQNLRIAAILFKLPKCSTISNDLVSIYIRLVLNKIRDFCCREDVPIQLEETAAFMVFDLLKTDGVIEDSSRKVSSISRGDTSIQYASSISDNAKDLLHNYESQLFKWRKLNVPKVSKNE